MILIQVWKGTALWILLPALIVGVFCIAIALPFALGKVPPNKTFGLGTPKTLSDEKAWYDSNRSVAKVALVVGGGLLLTALTMFLLWDMLSEMKRLMIMAAAVIVALAFLVSRAFKILDQLTD